MRERRTRPVAERRAKTVAAIMAVLAVGACSPPGVPATDAGSGVLVSCETSDYPMYFTAGPTLAAPVPARSDDPVRFEVYSGQPSEHDERVWADNLIERVASGVVVPAAVAGDRRAVTWPVPVDLATPRNVDPSVHAPSEFSWRTRSELVDRSPSTWSRWHVFDISLVIPSVDDCRVTADDIFWAWSYGRGHVTSGLLDEYAHARRLRDVFDELRARCPDDFTAAGDGHSSKRPDSGDESGEWIVLRGPIPAEAAEVLGQVRARPFSEGGGTLEVLDRRGYNTAQENTRRCLAEAAVDAANLGYLASARIASRTGILHLEIVRADRDSNGDEELRRRILEAVAAGTQLRVLPAEKDSLADASTLPTDVRIGDQDDFGHG